MYLRSLSLQNFRNYSLAKFNFTNKTVIIGPNTSGKTNLVEAVILLSSGKSFKAEKDFQMIKFGEDFARVNAIVSSDERKSKLEVIVVQGAITSGRFIKKYTVNNVSKSRSNFIGFLPTVLFRPEELEIIIDGPSLRRNFLDDVLEQIDAEFRIAKIIYDKGIRQRNALLERTRETGRRNEQEFRYWDNILINNGLIITTKREVFLNFVNDCPKGIFEFTTEYDKSVISRERLDQYKNEEIAAGNTLVGPQRDDFVIYMKDREKQNIQHFGSRGQQRLAVLQLKLLQMAYIEKSLGEKPLLILDDIFSELDNIHIKLILERVIDGQIIITTTHKEFIDKKFLKDFSVIELNHR